MTRLVWGDPNKRLYEFGVDRGAFYPQVGPGVPWNGLVAVLEAPSGGGNGERYYDGARLADPKKEGSFSATISAYTYPKEFEIYSGYRDRLTNQLRRYFNLSYRTMVGANSDSDYGYRIHLVYNAMTTPHKTSTTSISSTVGPELFEWTLETTPELLPSGEITSHLIVDASIAEPEAVLKLEEILYGTATTDPRFPTIPEVLDVFEGAALLKVTNHGDGTWTAEGPDSAFEWVDDTQFIITWPSVVYIDTETYTINSL